MAKIRSAPGLTPSAKLLMLEVFSRAGNGRGVCWASADTLGAGTGLSVRAVKRGLTDLAEAGWIIVDRGGASMNSPRREIRMGPSLVQALPREEPSAERPAREGDEPSTVPIWHSYCANSAQLLCQIGTQTTPITAPGTGGDGEEDGVDGEEERDPREPRGPVDAADVLRVASLCCYLPPNALRLLEGCRDLGARVEGDWQSLALAVVKTELGRARGVVDAVRHPLAYLTKAAASIRSGEVRVDDEVWDTLDAMLGSEGKGYRPPLNPGPVGALETPGMRREDALIPARVRGWAQQRWEELRWDGPPGIKLVEGYADPRVETRDVESVIRLEAMRDEARLALDAPAVERRKAWIEAALREMREQYG